MTSFQPTKSCTLILDKNSVTTALQTDLFLHPRGIVYSRYSRYMTRRNFLKTTGAGAVALATPKPSLFAAAADKPLRVALIGCGWYGKTDLLHLIQVAPVEVVALCDVDSKMVEATAELVAKRQPSRKKPSLFGDHRKLLADQRPEILLIGTPDH